jgi:hypothetical protein
VCVRESVCVDVCVRVYEYLYVYVSPYTRVVCVFFIYRAVGVSILSVELLV